MILPSFPPFSGHPEHPVRSSSGRVLMMMLDRMQSLYYSIHGQFATSRQQLERERDVGELWPSKELGRIENNWEISIQIKDDIAFTYAVPKYINSNLDPYSYVAATTAYDNTDKNQRIICRTLEPSTAQPAAPILQESQQFIFWRRDAKLVCSSGTEEIFKLHRR